MILYKSRKTKHLPYSVGGAILCVE